MTDASGRLGRIVGTMPGARWNDRERPPRSITAVPYESSSRGRRLECAITILAVLLIAGADATCSGASRPTAPAGSKAATSASSPRLRLPQSVGPFVFGKPWAGYRRACRSIAAVLRDEPVLCPAALPRPVPAINRVAPPRAYGYVCWRSHSHRHCLYPEDARAANPGMRSSRFYYLVNAFYGAPDENPSHQRRNTPRRFFHLMVWGGPVPDGALQLDDKARGRPLQRPLGSYSIDGRRGRLYHGLSYLHGGGEYANHFTFLTGTTSDRLVVSLHAWAPRAETLATLRALVSWLRVAG
jgi:hypothetical protein